MKKMNLQFSLLHELFISTVPIAARVWTIKMLPLYLLLRASVHLLIWEASIIPLNDKNFIPVRERERETKAVNFFRLRNEKLSIIIALSVLKIPCFFSSSQSIRLYPERCPPLGHYNQSFRKINMIALIWNLVRVEK